jgi:hypothetical protein
MAAMITHFSPDADLLAVLRPCIESGDCGDPDAEWPNNIISRNAVVYGSGVVARRDQPVRHHVDPNELGLCKRLAREALTVMRSVAVGMGSESRDEFEEFFVATNVDDPIASHIDEALIRSRFGDTLFSLATITVEPLKEEGRWWKWVIDDSASLYEGDYTGPADKYEENLPRYQEEHLRPWRAMIGWFRARSEFRDSAFVMIGDYDALHSLERSEWPRGTLVVPCALPRLALGLTRNGSLVGLFGFVVQT